MIGLKWAVKCYFEPRDIWLGVYWDRKPKTADPRLRWWDIYICLIPCFPIRFFQYIPF